MLLQAVCLVTFVILYGIYYVITRLLLVDWHISVTLILYKIMVLFLLIITI